MMCITKACEEPTAAGVYWRDDEEWKQFAAPHAEAIRRGMADRDTRVELGTLVSSKYAGGAKYAVDLRSMKQINLASGFTRDVKVVNAPAVGITSSEDIDRIEKELRDCQKEIMSLKELVMPEIMTLKEMVMKLEPDLLAVNLKLEAVKSDRSKSGDGKSFHRQPRAKLGDLAGLLEKLLRFLQGR